MSLGTKSTIVVDDLSIGKIEIGDILKVNNTEFRNVTSISEVDTTNIHDIFGDGSCKATYRLDGNGNDLGGLFNGSVVGGVYGLDGKYGKELMFRNGDRKRFGIPNILDFFNVSFSVSLWVKNIDKINGILFTNGVNSGNGVGSGWCIYSSLSVFRSANHVSGSNGRIQLSNVYTKLVERINKLTNVILSYNHLNGTVSAYIDGVFIESAVIGNYATKTSILYDPPGYPTSVPICTFGCDYLPGYPTPGDYSNTINANISHIRIFNRLITNDEALKLYAEKRYLIPVSPDLAELPTRVETVSSTENISSDTYFKTVDTTYDYEVLNTVTEVTYLANKKIKYQSLIYKSLKAVPIGISLDDEEYFTLLTGISLFDTVLAHANGKDDKNYLITEIESVKDSILNNTDSNVNGYRYLAKYRNSETILLEEKEPVFTGDYTPNDYKDSRVILKGNKWYRNIPNNTSILKNTDFNGLTDWQYGYRTTSTGVYVEGASTPPMVVVENNTLSLGNKPTTLWNGFIQQKIVIPKAGFYNISLDMIRADATTALGVYIFTRANGVIGTSGNALSADDGRMVISGLAVGGYSKKIWLTPSDNYIVLATGTGNATSETKNIIKNLKLIPDTSSLVELNPLSFLAKVLFRDGIPINIDDTWTPPKVIQEDTLINGKLITTGNRVWMEIGTVYLDQRLVIENPFGNENWKDTDVKAYIYHPITKRWEGCGWVHYVETVAYTFGILSFSTSEGIVAKTGIYTLITNDGRHDISSYPTVSNTKIDSANLAFSISYQPKSKNI